MFLIFLGLMDCLTTVIGIVYFSVIELNPLMAVLVTSNLPAFVVVKIGVSILVGVLLILAQRTLNNFIAKNKSYRLAKNILKVATASLTIFLLIVVANNLLVLANNI